MLFLPVSSYGQWVLDEEASLPLLKHAYDKGLNTWDTADTYSNGESERIVGKALKKYNIPRSRVVILSKCYFGVDLEKQQPIAALSTNDGQWVNQVGLSRKHIMDAVQASVDRLGTYIDVLQIHRLDRGTPREEIMRALNDVVNMGLVRYIGASSMAAWEFQSLQTIAKENRWHRFISMQNFHNLLYREEEREMIPYCQDTGVGLIPWSPLARGYLTRPLGEESIRHKSDKMLARVFLSKEDEADKAIIGRVEEVAKKKGISMAAVATAWSLSKGMIPIIGISSIERIDQACDNIKIQLTDEEIKFLEEPYVPKAVSGH
jgi:aryl-alcohol dehydrogenase-like predicted oxidoreductase